MLFPAVSGAGDGPVGLGLNASGLSFRVLGGIR